MAISKSEIQVRKARQVSITGSRYMFKKGDPVYLGARWGSSTPELVPWDIHCPRYISSSLYRDYGAPDEHSTHTETGDYGDIDNTYVASNKNFGATGSGSPQVFFSRNVDEGDGAVDAQTLISMTNNGVSTKNGTVGLRVSCLTINTDNLVVADDGMQVYSSQTSAPSAGYIKDDASYWYFWLLYVISADGFVRIIRVSKTSKAISQTATQQLTGINAPTMMAVDDTNEVFIIKDNTEFYTVNYDLAGWSTPSAEVSRTLQYMIDTYNYSGPSPTWLEHYLFDEENGITWFMEQSNSGSMKNANNTSLYIYNVYKMDWDGQGWTSYSQTQRNFETHNLYAGWSHQGGGYFVISQRPHHEGSLRYMAPDSSVMWDHYAEKQMGAVESVSYQTRNPNRSNQWVYSGPNWGGYRACGGYLSGVMYWGGDTMDGSKFRPGWDMAYVMSSVFGASYGAMVNAASYDDYMWQGIIGEDEDYLYGVHCHGNNTSATWYNGAGFKVRKPYPLISRGKIGIALTNCTEGARGQTMLRGGANLSDGDTVTIDGKVYTFQTTLTNTDGNVKIHATLLSETLSNLRNAMKVGPFSGTAYAAVTTVHPTCRAWSYSLGDDNDLIIITVDRTADTIAVSENAVELSFDDATLQGGVDRGNMDLELHTPGIEFEAGGIENTLTYQGVHYPAIWLEGHFDMSHCLPDVVQTVRMQESDAGITSPDSDDILASQYNGLIIEYNGMGIDETHVHYKTWLRYVLSRGRGFIFGRVLGGQVLQTEFTIGLLK